MFLVAVDVTACNTEVIVHMQKNKCGVAHSFMHSVCVIVNVYLSHFRLIYANIYPCNDMLYGFVEV